ncbi:hypothetical protein VE03_05517 [Pseudogymnoascus sp. 23342-1-I1]|nr:hypothetical protein VE03_05517 [Pseudogymnoascus sp. 23342-1-I1]
MDPSLLTAYQAVPSPTNLPVPAYPVGPGTPLCLFAGPFASYSLIVLSASIVLGSIGSIILANFIQVLANPKTSPTEPSPLHDIEPVSPHPTASKVAQAQPPITASIAFTLGTFGLAALLAAQAVFGMSLVSILACTVPNDFVNPLSFVSITAFALSVCSSLFKVIPAWVLLGCRAYAECKGIHRLVLARRVLMLLFTPVWLVYVLVVKAVRRGFGIEIRRGASGDRETEKEKEKEVSVKGDGGATREDGGRTLEEQPLACVGDRYPPLDRVSDRERCFHL